MNKKRISLEIIRIFAIFGVVFGHSGESGYELLTATQSKGLWIFAAIADPICLSVIPLFFMVSGVLLLGKDESLKDLFIKRVLRYAIIIVLFSFIYYVRLVVKNPEYGFSIKFFIKSIYEKSIIIPYWFLYSYLAFLLMLPFLRAMVRNLKEEDYILLACISLVLSYLVIPESVVKFSPIFFTIDLTAQNIMYPILGYGIANVLSDKWFSIKARISVAVLFIINIVAVFYMLSVEYKIDGAYSYNYINRFKFIPAIFVFYFVIYLFEKKGITFSSRIEKFICLVGGCTFSTYLFEDILRSDIFIRMIRWSSSEVVNLLMIIPYSICMITCGVLISLLLRKIPIIKKLRL